MGPALQFGGGSSVISVNSFCILFALVLSRFGILETSLVFAASFASPLEAVVCSTRRPVRLVDAMAFPSVVAALSCLYYSLDKTNSDWLRLEAYRRRSGWVLCSDYVIH